MEFVKNGGVAVWNVLSSVVAFALLSGGCSHSRDKLGESTYTHSFAPQAPTFMTGPSSVLLTNRPGYTARVTIQSEDLSHPAARAGQLYCGGGTLFYGPEAKGADGKTVDDSGFAFVWDVAKSEGFVLSEALQGYAPFSSSQRVTNVTFQSASVVGTAGKEPGSPAEAEMQLGDGTKARFHVWRASGFNGPPLRISTITNATPFDVRITNVRIGPPPAELFSPPNGFTKYSSPEAMMDELVARKLNLRRKAAPELPPLTPNEPK